MAKSPAFQFYASDFLTDTQSWDINEVGIYIRLLSNQWVNGCLPSDLTRLSRIAGCTHEEIKKAWVILGFKFLPKEDGSIYNRKLESVRDEQNRFREKQASNGRQGGRPRKTDNPKETQQKPKQNPNNNPKESSSSSTSSIKEIKKEKIPSSSNAVYMYMLLETSDESKSKEQSELFFDHFTSNGWKVGGKTAMQDWHSAVRNWLKRNNSAPNLFGKKQTVEANELDF